MRQVEFLGKMPDPFKKEDGTRMTPEEWKEKRNEIRDMIVDIEYGGMPPRPEYVDFERIKVAEPKWYMGFSDNTNMTYLLATICDTASIYGPCASSFGMEPWHESIQDALDLLT